MKILEQILQEIDKKEEEYFYEEHGPGFSMGSCSMASDIKEIIRSHMENDGWIPVDERLPEEIGDYWAVTKKEDGTINKPTVVRYCGIPKSFVIDTPNGREYETWGHDGAFYGNKVIAWQPYYTPEPYQPKEEKLMKMNVAEGER